MNASVTLNVPLSPVIILKPRIFVLNSRIWFILRDCRVGYSPATMKEKKDHTWVKLKWGLRLEMDINDQENPKLCWTCFRCQTLPVTTRYLLWTNICKSAVRLGNTLRPRFVFTNVMSRTRTRWKQILRTFSEWCFLVRRWKNQFGEWWCKVVLIWSLEFSP